LKIYGRGEGLDPIFGILLACLHDQNKSGFFEGLAFNQPIRAILKLFKKLRLAGKNPALQKATFVLIM